MRPRDRGAVGALPDEVLEEHRGEQHPGRGVARLRVRDVRDVGVEDGAELAGQRHPPHQLVGRLSRREEAVHRLIVAHDRDVAGAECDGRRAREGRDVDDGVGLLLARGDEAVREHEPALGVGVEHLDGLPAADGEHVVRPGGAARRHVLRDAQPRRDPHGQFEPGGGECDGQHGGGARHVVLHAHHRGGGLQGEAAAVEGDPLADQSNVRRRALGRPGDLDEPRRADRALSHPEDAAEPVALQRLGVPLGELDVEALRQRVRALGERLRVEVRRGSVDEIPDGGDRPGRRLGTGDERVCVDGLGDDRDLRSRGLVGGE
ncbi:hypothetical protein GCM10025866_27180 [Naasia aerilata]|uniref:Uncharacterized protein n=1 Tax=Naasia aerilata TaxID=1162966 RepID=A0ABN6XPL8_9MICO|nr:hypothetical protein GCM10025866_27180 [Naasia aerilata]